MRACWQSKSGDESAPGPDLSDSGFARQLAREGKLIIAPLGTSMRPFLRGSQDAIVLEAPSRPLRRHDVALYRRKNGAWVAHRVMGVSGGLLTFCGDHLTELEPGIHPDQVLAVMTGFFRGEVYHSADEPKYRWYCRLWCGSLTLRRAALWAWPLVKKLRGGRHK